MIEFRKATLDDAPVLAAARPKMWATTYRGIYSDEKIDNYDLAWHTARDRKRMEDPEQVFYLLLDEGACVGYFHYGPPHCEPYRDFQLCLNSLYFLK